MTEVRLSVAFLIMVLVFASPVFGAAGGPETATPPAGVSAEEALRLGEAMYMQGKLPSGKPMKAIVQRDMVVKGSMLTCANCHMRGGLGSFEGGVTTLPTNGAKLYSPLRSGYDLPSTSMGARPLKTPRPAYTDETLARALRLGVDPAGRQMSRTMPRYILADREVEIMIFYLKNLSSKYSSGATLEEIRLATVVSDSRPPTEQWLMSIPAKLALEVRHSRGSNRESISL